MNNKLQVNRTLRIVLFVSIALFLSFNTYAVKKTATRLDSKQVEETSVDLTKKEKPNLAQRLGMKILLKKLVKKTKKQSQNTRTEESKLKKGMAVAALVLGIVSFFLSFLGIVTAILAIIFGAIARKRAKNNPEIYGGKGMASAGMVLGIIYLTLALIVLGVLVFSSLFFF